MLKEYAIVNDVVVASGDKQVHAFTNTEHTVDQLVKLNVLSAAQEKLEEDKLLLEEVNEDRKNAKKKFISTSSFYGFASLTLGYLCAHLSVAPFDGNVNKLLTSFAIHAGIFAGATISANAVSIFGKYSKKDLASVTGAIECDKELIEQTEDELEKFKQYKPKKEKIEVYGSVDTDTIRDDVYDELTLVNIYNVYNKEVKKAYLKGKLPQFLSSFGLDSISQPIYENFIKNIEGSLYSEEQMVEENGVDFVK